MTGSSLLTSACRALAAATLAALAGAAAAQAPAPAQAPASAPQIANPASQNCVAKGGQVVLQKNPRGGQYGVCVFADNMQCEEWAMLRGQCPTGGIRVTGYVTAAARYCAITGGTYTITGASNTPQERGTCSFARGKTCSAAAWYNGSCTREPAKAAAAGTASSTGVTTGTASTGATGTTSGLPARVQARFTCADGKSIAATFVNTGNARVQLTLSDGRQMTLPQAMSASGARYANKGETVVFWNKGNTAFIEEGGKTTYADCATKS